MSTEKIIQMAFELGNTIAQSEEIQSLKDTQAKLIKDQEASALVGNYQEALTKIENKMRDGLQIVPEEEQQMEALKQQLNGNPMVQELIQVQEKLNNLMQSVYFAINQAMAGEDCSSDCSSCGGSCGM
ncbi:MAG: YlbF family regulator [Syntrophomonas sp.]|nr:YlbF family regulator [Syntrophomonas sp.]